MLSRDFQGFAVLVATVKFVALNLKEVDSHKEFLPYPAIMAVKFP